MDNSRLIGTEDGLGIKINTKFNKKILGLEIATDLILVSWSIVAEVDILFLILLLIWSNMMLYCCNRISNRILLFCFGISFFVFLIGRDGLEQFFDVESETPFIDKTNRHAYLSMIISLLSIWIIYSIFNPKNTIKYAKRKVNNLSYSYYYYVRKYSKWCFWVTYPFAIILNLGIAYFVLRFGYHSYYTDLSGIIDSSPIFTLLSKIEITMPAAFAVFMATLPTKPEFKKLAIPYIVYLVLTLGSGQRGAFLLGILLFVIFFMYMQQLQPETIWIKKSYIRAFIISMPLIAISASLINSIRFEREEDTSIFDSFTSFFYDQGVSSNVIKRAYELETQIPTQHDPYVLEFLHTGLPARIIGNEVYHGNTIEHATKGGSFVHAFGYTVMGKKYLSGGGPGTSYIAELYYDYGYIGIILGSCLYGYLFTLINNFKSASLFRRAVVFIVITQLLWAPRGSYSGFLSFLFAPTTLTLLMFVFIGAQISYTNYRKKHQKQFDY